MNILITGGTGCIARNFVMTMLESNPNLSISILTSRPQRAAKIYHAYGNNIKIETSINEETTAPDILLNLAGAPIISGPISFRNYTEIETSRIDFTKNLCRRLRKYNLFPNLFISASAAGIYREAAETHSEQSVLLGGDFIGNLAMNWENAVWEGCKTAPTRTVLLRLGNVVAPESMFFQKMRTVFKLGLGFKLTGKEITMPWIDMSDVLGSIAHIIRNSDIKGPVNLTSPEYVTFNQFADVLASALGQKTHFNLSPNLFKLTQGRLAPAITKSIQVRPKILVDSGYTFSCPNIETAIWDILGR